MVSCSANSCIAIRLFSLLLAIRMEWFPVTPLPGLRYLFLALASYGLFLLLAVVSRVGKGRQALGRFHRLHFRTATGYLLASLADLIFNGRDVTLISGSDWLIGLFVYFGIHYAIVANFFAIAQASVSTSVISILYARGGRATRAVCMANYAGGEGFGYIKRTRLARIQNLLGWIKVQDGRYYLTDAGRRSAWFTQVMLRLWGVDQIGKVTKP